MSQSGRVADPKEKYFTKYFTKLSEHARKLFFRMGVVENLKKCVSV
jgi:hypothetical protein